MNEVALGYATARLDAFSGEAAEPSAAADRLLARLSGAEAAVITGSVASAAWIVFSALAGKREVLVARSQVSQIGDCRLPDVISAAGAVQRDVGLTSRATSDDFAAAIGAQTAILFCASPASFEITGDSAALPIAELVALGRRSNVPVVHDLGLGSIGDCAASGLTNLPTAKGSLEAGADLVLLAGDRLLGGPPCGVILGTRSLVQSIRRHPLLPALHVNPPTLAALLATLRLYEEPGAAERSIPLLSLLATPVENLRNRAERLAPQIAATRVAAVEVRQTTTTLTGAQLPAQTLPTVCLCLTPASGTPASLAAALRMATPAVVGRLDEGRVVLDLRSVPPRCDVPLITAIEGLARAAAPAAAGEAAQPTPTPPTPTPPTPA